MNYRKILVISDNLSLCLSFKKILVEKSINKLISVNYSVSPYSKAILFEKSMKEDVLVYDLKKEEDINEIIASYDLVFSIHCKQLFPVNLVNNLKCINVHPGYNPINRGWYPQVFSIIDDLPIGATIHEIDEELDHGNIIAREFVEKRMSDTSESLYNRIVKKEIELLNRNIENILNKDYNVIKPKEKGNLYLKKDFNKLCEIDLNEETTMLKAINKLRALSHGDFKNAFFIDEKTKRKIYVKVELYNE